jgi:hypothetical protein
VDDVLARIVWKLARRHPWGTPTPRRELVRSVTGSSDHDTVEDALDTHLEGLEILRQGPRGYAIPNSQVAHRKAAAWLSRYAELSDLKIAATLSRLPEDWPE